MRTDENKEDIEEDGIASHPDDDLANKAQIQEAITNLYNNVSMKKRLIAVATLILRGKPHLKRQYEPEDLFQEALERIGIGKRKWPKNRVDFPGLVIGVMKSWSFSLEKSKALEDVKVVMEHEFASAAAGDDALNLEEIAIDSMTPIEHLEATQLDIQWESLFVILKSQYQPQELPARILAVVTEDTFETLEEIRLALGVKESDFRNAWKVLMRAATKLEPKE
ncbi:hypothetical protein AKG95_22680 [Janthinobacterium lividum]|uniref:Uncharacterized protein n=1 Tax=Janthinobacterium lividum TaxID=29581 RepID=A0A1S1U3R0_9BURK|nr:hypothetical protein [Janthinobacterium lividum]OHV95087.1 hypothetical protein AKG95_22680 [Janthinobacterium lividum]